MLFHFLLLQSRLGLRRAAFVLVGLAVALLLPAGCGSSGSTAATVPLSVPSGAVAIVGSARIPAASFSHWLTILRSIRGAHGDAKDATVTFLVKAQWLAQEADAEGINQAVLDKLVAQRAVALPQLASGLTRADGAFQTRLDVIAEALQQRHERAPGKLQSAAISRYYTSHRLQFRSPRVLDTRMVVTRTRAAALEARIALQQGRSWAAVAKRFSVDSSAAVGGRYPIVAGGPQSPKLRHAALSAPRGRLIGPLQAMPAASPRSEYFVFEVIGESAARQQPLSEVAPQIRQVLAEQRSRGALASFEGSFLRRWRERTLCAPAYLVPQCRNYEPRR